MTMTYYEIPLKSVAQTFKITLAGKPYQMRLVWRTGEDAGWFLDISTSAGVLVLGGVPLVTGADLLAQYPDLGFGGELRVTTDANPDAVPTYANLGGQAHVYFGVAS